MIDMTIVILPTVIRDQQSSQNKSYKGSRVKVENRNSNL